MPNRQRQTLSLFDPCHQICQTVQVPSSCQLDCCRYLASATHFPLALHKLLFFTFTLSVRRRTTPGNFLCRLIAELLENEQCRCGQPNIVLEAECSYRNAQKNIFKSRKKRLVKWLHVRIIFILLLGALHMTRAHKKQFLYAVLLAI